MSVIDGTTLATHCTMAAGVDDILRDGVFANRGAASMCKFAAPWADQDGKDVYAHGTKIQAVIFN